MSGKDTKYADLESTLKAVGKAVFVNFYYDFKNAEISMEALSEKIYRENPLAKSTQQRFRIPRARHIFAENQHLEALRIIIESPKVNEQARRLAQKILQDEMYELSFAGESEQESVLRSEINREIIYSEDKSCADYDTAPQMPKEMFSETHYRYQRNKAVAVNALRRANHKCEVDTDHYIFRRKNSTLGYTEPHHLIPLSAQKFFPNVNLDREQNIVSLCSNCHNCLHYGAEIDDKLKPLYEKRKKLLEAIGITITYEQLRIFYV